MVNNDSSILNRDCQNYNYGDIMPREYGAFCTRHKKFISETICSSTINCKICGENKNKESE